MAERKGKRDAECKIEHEPIAVLTELHRYQVEIIVEYLTDPDYLYSDVLTTLLHIDHPGVLKRLRRTYILHVKCKPFPYYDPPIPTDVDERYAFYRRMFRLPGKTVSYGAQGLTTPNAKHCYMQFDRLVRAHCPCLICRELTGYDQETVINLWDMQYAVCRLCQPEARKLVMEGCKIQRCLKCHWQYVATNKWNALYCNKSNCEY